MKKEEFIALVKETGSYKNLDEAKTAVQAFTEAVAIALEKKEDVNLVGFGSFVSVLQKGKTGKVPGTNKEYKTEDKFVPKFKAGKSIKDRVALGK